MTSKFSFENEQDEDDGERHDIEVVEDFDYEISENVVEDLVEYSRSNVIKNEEQFVLIFLSYGSGFMASPDYYVSGVVIGETASGKTHLQGKVEKLYPDPYLYQATSGSDTSIIYDDTWEDAYIAALDELQKPSEKIIEILKSLHGDDEEFRYKVTTDGDGADRGVDEIVRTAMPYWFLYAQHDPDLEMWSRLLKIPVHESSSKNKGVVKKNWGHESIQFNDDTDIDYIRESHDLECALQELVANVPKNARVKIPAGEEKFGWDAIEHVEGIFDFSKSETNRASAMVANLVRSSALFNYKNRDIEEIYVEDEDEYKEHYIAEPQDVANIISCRETLLATTHEINKKKMAICNAIEEKSGGKNMATIDSIKEYLNERDAPKIKRKQIESMLTELRENYFIERHERAAENNKNLYEFKGWGRNLGYVNVDESFRDVFGDCVNPITGENFVEYVERMNEDILSSAKDFGSIEEDIESGGAQSRISDEDKKYKLRPHVEKILQLLYDKNGRENNYNDGDEVLTQDMLGIEDKSGTLFGEEHEMWEQIGKPDDWVANSKDAVGEIEDTMRELVEFGLFKTEHHKDGSSTVYVKNPEELEITVTEKINNRIMEV